MTIDQNRIISTWLYLESPSEMGIYPQVPGRSNTDGFQDIYRRCLVSFFLTSRLANPNAILILFTNSEESISQTYIGKKLLQKLSQLEVKIIELPYKYAPPLKQTKWRNQFFVVDVLEYFSLNSLPADLILILDSDIVWSGRGAVVEFWEDLQANGFLSMCPILDEFERINGYTVAELNLLAAKLGNQGSKIEKYSGGEFIGLRGDILQNVFKETREVLETFRNLSKERHLEYIEEAHLLTIAYSRLRLEPGHADQYIRRIWTQFLHYQNRQKNDLNLLMWHIPAEKRYGLKRLADDILNHPWSNIDINLLPPKMDKKLGIGRNSIKKVFFDTVDSVKYKIKTQL